MTTPSEPLLHQLRALAKARGLSAERLAVRAGLDPDDLSATLHGERAMTVDQLILITQALDLTPEELGLPADPTGPRPVTADDEPLPYDAPGDPLHDHLDEDLDDGPDLSVASDSSDGPDDLDLAVDPYDNHIRQLFQVGFALGCDFFFHADASVLTESGVPAAVLERYKSSVLPIKLDAAYHQYNDPRYERAGLRLKLSFDDVYDCYFPWSAVQRVIFSPIAPELEPEPEPEPDKPKGAAPFLRLVE